jgi:hypothetical protein
VAEAFAQTKAIARTKAGAMGAKAKVEATVVEAAEAVEALQK